MLDLSQRVFAASFDCLHNGRCDIGRGRDGNRAWRCPNTSSVWKQTKAPQFHNPSVPLLLELPEKLLLPPPGAPARISRVAWPLGFGSYGNKNGPGRR